MSCINTIRTLDEIIADPTGQAEEVAEHESGIMVGVTADAQCQIPTNELYVAEVVRGPKIRAWRSDEDGRHEMAVVELPATVAEGVARAVAMVQADIAENDFERELLTREEAAALYGVRPDTFGSYVSRGQGPAPDVQHGRTPMWERVTILAAVQSRQGRLP